MAKFLFSLLIALWVVAIAILAVQNATPVSLKLFTLTSIQMPLGVVLAFSAALGMIGTNLVLLLWQRTGKRRPVQSR